MLEKMPRALGEALSGVKAGLDGTAYRAAFADVPEVVSVASPAFTEGGAMPARFTQDGAGTSPPLTWDGLPAGTAAVALLVEDAGSPTPRPLVHLIAWNLGAGAVAEGALADGAVPEGVHLGKNSFLKAGWLPPDPPTGHGPHAYLFQVYALDRPLDLPDGTGRGAVVEAMRGRVLGKGCLTGTYARA